MQDQKFRQGIKKMGWAVIIVAMLIMLYPFITDLVNSPEDYEPLDLLAEPEVYEGRASGEFGGALLKIPAKELLPRNLRRQ